MSVAGEVSNEVTELSNNGASLKGSGMVLLRLLDPNRRFSFVSHDGALAATSALGNVPLAALAPAWC